MLFRSVTITTIKVLNFQHNIIIIFSHMFNRHFSGLKSFQDETNRVLVAIKLLVREVLISIIKTSS